MTHNSDLGEGNSATEIEEGYGSVSGAITPEQEEEYGLELGSGMGMTLEIDILIDWCGKTNFYIY